MAHSTYIIYHIYFIGNPFLKTAEERFEWICLATRYRYSFPVMAELSRDQGCKFVTLINRLEASDRAIRQALDHLMEAGWVMRNPGYGHPMRPEYILTERGSSYGPSALGIWDALREWKEEVVALERWPLPLLQLLLSGAGRFGEIKTLAAGITPRALAMALSRLQESGLATRAVIDGHPPTAEYSPTKWARELMSNLG